MKNYNRFKCLDCGVNTGKKGIKEYYMVHNDLWKAANQKQPAHMLCIGCLEVRLERRLRPQDFTDCPLNKTPTRTRSHRLNNRMGKRCV